MRNDCWLKPATARKEFIEFFSETDRQLSTYYEENPNVREEHIESRLVTLLESTPFGIYQDRLNRERTADARPLLTLKFKHITNKEGGHGADIGLVARLNIPGEMVQTKASLIQGKRLNPSRHGFTESCEYSELFKRENTLPPQWDRMLDLTSSSVYFFYNPDRLRIGRTIKTVRTRVISAQVIKGKADARQHRMTVEDVYKNSKPFSSWVMDEFICCGIGDTRPEIIHIAMGENTNFTVRHSIQMTIERIDVRPDLFAR